MNWSKIKTLMIYFLLGMNIFMIAFIAISMWRDYAVPDNVINATLNILEKNNFECEKTLIPTTTYDLSDLNVSFYSESELSEIFFSKQLAFKTSEKSLVAQSGGATLTVTDSHFVFENGKSADTTVSERRIKKALKNAGINMDFAVYDKKERCFYRMYNGVNLFNMYLKAELDHNGEICYVSALWPGELTPYNDVRLSFSASIKKVKEAFPEGGKIELVEPGYLLIPVGGNRYTFKPSWRVKINGELKILE